MVLETARLALRYLTAADSAFILELVTDPDWLRFIGDRGVRTAEDARGYIERGPMKLYERLGFAYERTVPWGSGGEVSRLYALNA